jgi:hypothetical protein
MRTSPCRADQLARLYRASHLAAAQTRPAQPVRFVPVSDPGPCAESLADEPLDGWPKLVVVDRFSPAHPVERRHACRAGPSTPARGRCHTQFCSELTRLDCVFLGTSYLPWRTTKAGDVTTTVGVVGATDPAVTTHPAARTSREAARMARRPSTTARGAAGPDCARPRRAAGSRTRGVARLGCRHRVADPGACRRGDQPTATG